MNFGARAIDFFLIGVVIVQTATAASAAEPAAPSRPNIVVIVADDLGYSDLGSFGGEIRTPNLDALAAEGTRFANFHVAGECSPTRAMLLTGVRSHRTGVGAMHESVPRELEGKPGYLTVLKPDVLTVSSLLQRNGYRTYAVGKWHVGKEPYNLPPARGFDHSIVQGDSGSDNWVPTQRYLALTDRVYWFEDGKPATMPGEYYSSTFYADRAIAYLRNDWAAQRSAASETRPPFFLYLAFQANHTPLQAPADMVARQRGRYDAGWQVIREQRFRRTQELGLLPPGTQLAAWPGLEDWNTLDPKRRSYETRRMEVYAGMAHTGSMDSVQVGTDDAWRPILMNYRGYMGEVGLSLSVFNGLIRLNGQLAATEELRPGFLSNGRIPKWYEYFSWSIDLKRLNPHDLVRNFRM